MVTEINATQIDTQDKLTDQVYHYDVTDKVFEKASRYEDRRIEKEELPVEYDYPYDDSHFFYLDL